MNTNKWMLVLLAALCVLPAGCKWVDRTRLTEANESLKEQLKANEALKAQLVTVKIELLAYQKQCRELPGVRQQVKKLEAQNEKLQARLAQFVPDESHPISRSRFSSIVQGMTRNELYDYIGGPSTVMGMMSPQTFTYKQGLTYDPADKTKDSSVALVLCNQRVTEITFVK